MSNIVKYNAQRSIGHFLQRSAMIVNYDTRSFSSSVLQGRTVSIFIIFSYTCTEYYDILLCTYREYSMIQYIKNNIISAYYMHTTYSSKQRVYVIYITSYCIYLFYTLLSLSVYTEYIRICSKREETKRGYHSTILSIYTESM